MKKRITLFILLIFSVGFISSTVVDIVSKQQVDFEVFQTALTQKEGKIDLHTSKDSINVYLKELQEELRTEKNILEQFKLYSSTLAKLKCGHTQIMPDRKLLSAFKGESNSLPLDYYLIGRHLISNGLKSEDRQIIYSGKPLYQKNKRIPKGSEILSIDHLSVGEMVNEMGKYISSDEGTMDFKYFQASQMFEFYRHLALPYQKDSIAVQYVSPENDTSEIYLTPGPVPTHTMDDRLFNYVTNYMAKESDPGKFKIVNSEYGYFRFKSFSASGGKNYEIFLEESFQKMRTNKINKLIVDLRGNTGGIMQYSFMKYMVGEDVEIGKYIISKPNSKSQNKHIKKFNIHYLRYAILSGQQKRRQKNGRFNEGIVKTDFVNSDLVFEGDVVVITDEGTFSSAAILAGQLKTMTNAKIVGRPAGGSFYAGNAGTLIVKLPESGFQMAVNPNTYYSQLETTPQDPSIIKQPDIFVDPLILNQKKRNLFYFKKAMSLFE